MELFDELKELGVGVDDALSLLNGNAALYERLLGTFADQIKETDVRPDFESGDYAEALDKVHRLKGAAGNLSLTPLYKAYSEIVRLLREEKPEQAKEVFTGVLPEQENIVRCIESHRQQ